MTASEKYSIIKKACESHHVCEIQLREEPAYRLIQPLGVCLTFKRGLIIVARQVGGYGSKSSPQFKNFPIEDCETIKMLPNKFSLHPEFFSHESRQCSDWLFHV